MSSFFPLTNKHLRNENKIGFLAVEVFPETLQDLGKNVRYDDVIFEFTKTDIGKKSSRWARERLQSLAWR